MALSSTEDKLSGSKMAAARRGDQTTCEANMTKMFSTNIYSMQVQKMLNWFSCDYQVQQ